MCPRRVFPCVTRWLCVRESRAWTVREGAQRVWRHASGHGHGEPELPVPQKVIRARFLLW